MCNKGPVVAIINYCYSLTLSLLLDKWQSFCARCHTAVLKNVYHTDLLLCWMVVFPKTGGFCPKHQSTFDQSIRCHCSLKGVSLAFRLSTVNAFEIQEKSYKAASTLGFQLIDLVLLFPPLCCWDIYRNKILIKKKKKLYGSIVTILY